MARPIIALLTDFGARDHYVATMKGVALGICPDATLVDLTHEIEPQDVLGAALELTASYRFFPEGTVFLVVVDPGVGSTRRAVAVEAGGFRFVAPDNGVLAAALERQPAVRIVELANPQYARAVVSRTFEGRDRFAPAAAWLARGLDLAELGPLRQELVTLQIPAPIVADGRIEGQVLRVDRFGNLITNIGRRAVEGLGSGGTTVAIGSREIAALVPSYAGAQPGALCALFGSSDALEIAVNGGSAARELSAGRGVVVTVSRGT